MDDDDQKYNINDIQIGQIIITKGCNISMDIPSLINSITGYVHTEMI